MILEINLIIYIKFSIRRDKSIYQNKKGEGETTHPRNISFLFLSPFPDNPIAKLFSDTTVKHITIITLNSV